jgi:hypothetical protein
LGPGVFGNVGHELASFYGQFSDVDAFKHLAFATNTSIHSQLALSGVSLVSLAGFSAKKYLFLTDALLKLCKLVHLLLRRFKSILLLQ